MKKLNLVLAFCFIMLLSKAEKNPTITFTENKGQISDQNYKPRLDILYGGTANGMAFHVRNNTAASTFGREKNVSLLIKLCIF